jgi:GT2 family glycosyltransferase
LEESLEQFFSSSDPELVERVYSFGRDKIISWMRKRERAKIRFFETEGETEVVVVVPTADAKGSRAREVVEVFNPLKVIFVESNGPLFNYATSVNAGVSRALNYSPKWIVISNDDVHGRDPVKKLLDELSTTNRGLVMASPSSYHTYPVSLIEVRPYFLKGMKFIGKALRLPPAEVYADLTLRYGKALGIKTLIVINSMLGPLKKVAGEVKMEVINAGSFMVVNRRVANERLLDETFINGYEDVLFSMKMKDDFEVIQFNLDEERGGSLGFGKMRFLKAYVNEVYLNYLLWG